MTPAASSSLSREDSEDRERKRCSAVDVFVVMEENGEVAISELTTCSMQGMRNAIQKNAEERRSTLDPGLWMHAFAR
jgi:hypothetical protein